MRRGIFRLHALATLLASSLLCQTPAHAQQAPARASRALVGASVLDVETGKAIPDAVVVITAGRYNQPDKLLGTTRTGPKGNWKFKVSLITSAYYAYAERKTSASIGFNCRPARSRIVAAD